MGLKRQIQLQEVIKNDKKKQRQQKSCRNDWSQSSDTVLDYDINCLITKTYLYRYNFDPLKPHFYVVKLGFTRYTLFFLLKNIDCGYSL